MELFYSNKTNFNPIGFVDSRYLFDTHKVRSPTGYLFTYGGTAIS